jgi:hypothetical protein
MSAEMSPEMGAERPVVRRRLWPTVLLILGVLLVATGGIGLVVTAWDNQVCVGSVGAFAVDTCRGRTRWHAAANIGFALGLVLVLGAVIGYATDRARRGPQHPASNWPY